MKNAFVATVLLVLCVAPLQAGQDLAQAVAKDYDESLAELFVWFHSHPELSFREYETAARLAEERVGGARAMQADLDADEAGGPAVPSHHSPFFKIEAEPSVTMGVEAMTVAVLELLGTK